MLIQSHHAARRHASAIRRALAVAAVLACGLSAGCLSDETRQQMADADSILAPVFKTTTPADAAAWAADPYDADKRARGMNLLANAPFGGTDAYLNLYRDRLKDESAPVRAVAARGLALHGGPSDVEKIIPLLSQEEAQVRLEATRALQRLHNPVAVGPLIDRLNISKEGEPEIRAEAADALGQYAEGRVLQALAASLADSSLLVQTTAHRSLQTLTGNDQLPPERKPWVAWIKEHDKPFADQRAYVYPVFWREKRWLDYVPFMPAVPNEQAGNPAGFNMDAATAAAPTGTKAGG